jgi:ankyrin repeat protein
MVAARYHGNSETVRRLLAAKAKVQVNKGDEVKNDGSALVLAAFSGDVKIAEALLDAGARRDETMRVLGTLPLTPLLGAAMRGDNAMVEFLISRDADPNLDVTDTPLNRAVINNHAETVKLLLAKGAKVNHADEDMMTPLHYAASVHYGDTDVVDALLAAKADRNARNKDKKTPLDLATAYGHTAVAKVLANR